MQSKLGRFALAIYNAVTPDTTRKASTPEEIREMIAGGGGSEDFPHVTDGQALRVAAVYACVRLLSEAVGMLPVSLYRREGDKHVPAENHPLFDVLTAAPNGWQTPFEFFRGAMVHVLMRGNFYAQKVRVGNRIVALRPLNPAMTKPFVSDTGLITYKYNRGNGQIVQFSQEEILHYRGLSVDGVQGMAVLEAARNAIGLSVSTELHGAKLFKNGARPSGVLSHPSNLSKEAVERLKTDFDERYSGSSNAWRPMVLEEGMKWDQMQMTAEDSQFIDSRKFSRSEIAMFFGVPPHAIGDVERGTSWGSGIEQQNLGFLVHTLKPYLVNFAQATVRDLLPSGERGKYVVKFDTAELTRADFLARQNGLQIQRRNGVINVDEWRQVEGLNPINDEASQRREIIGGGNGSVDQSAALEPPAERKNQGEGERTRAGVVPFARDRRAA